MKMNSVEEKMKALEEGLVSMFKANKFSLDFVNLGEGKYQFTKDGEPCVFDEESEFRLRIFLNSFNVLTDHDKGEEVGN